MKNIFSNFGSDGHGSRRIISSILLTALLASMASCGSGGDTKDTVTSGGDSSSTAEETTDARLALDDGLPEKDLDGYEFRILTSYGSKKPVALTYVPEEATGDVVVDATYKRNQKIEERFNCKIIETDTGTTNWQDQTNMIKNTIMSDEDAWDLTINHIIGGPNISLENCFVDYYTMNYIDFSKPWWSDQMVDEMTVRGQAYLLGDVIGLDALKSAKVLYLNKPKFEEWNRELPYQDVFDGTWTMDKLFALTSDVYSDLNGNSERDVEDFYGYISHASQNGWLVSCDVPVLEKESDGHLEIVVNGDKVASLVEKLYKFYYETTGSLIIRGNDPVTGVSQGEWQTQLFADGHGLVGFSQIYAAANELRDSNVEYGIIPFPKWDEKQESYRVFCGGGLLGVPVTVRNLDNTGLILEALAAETYKTVVPAYFGTALKEKFTYDSESGKCLDIINDNLAISFAYAYDNWQGFGHMLGAILASDKPSADYASFYAGRIKSAEARLKLINDFFEANEK